MKTNGIGMKKMIKIFILQSILPDFKEKELKYSIAMEEEQTGFYYNGTGLPTLITITIHLLFASLWKFHLANWRAEKILRVFCLRIIFVMMSGKKIKFIGVEKYLKLLIFPRNLESNKANWVCSYWLSYEYLLWLSIKEMMLSKWCLQFQAALNMSC